MISSNSPWRKGGSEHISLDNNSSSQGHHGRLDRSGARCRGSAGGRPNQPLQRTMLALGPLQIMVESHITHAFRACVQGRHTPLNGRFGMRQEMS